MTGQNDAAWQQCCLRSDRNVLYSLWLEVKQKFTQDDQIKFVLRPFFRNPCFTHFNIGVIFKSNTRQIDRFVNTVACQQTITTRGQFSREFTVGTTGFKGIGKAFTG